jgi:pre-mRNA-splicing factor SYF1
MGGDYQRTQEEDLLYEEELLRNPYTLKLWWRYVEARKGADSRRRYLLYERAVKCLPGSYKVQHRRRPCNTVGSTRPLVD